MAQRFLSNIRVNDAYTLPASDGTSGQVIATDGAGNLTFQDADTIVITNEADIVYYLAKNSSGATIPKGTAVMAVGTDGNSGHILIAPFIADGSVEPKFFIGVTESEVLNGSIVRVIDFGQISQINTAAYQDGDVLWCDPANPGGFTLTEPEGPNSKVAAAIVINASTNGKILVRVSVNEGLHELHDTKFTNLSNKDILAYNQAGSYWENTKELDTVSLNSLQASEDIQTAALHTGVLATPKTITQDVAIQENYNAFLFTPVSVNATITVGNNSDLKIIDL